MLVSRALFLFMSIPICQGGADDQPKVANPNTNTTLSMVVNLRMPADTKYTDVWRIIDSLQKQGVKRWILSAAKAGEAPSAEVVADLPPNRPLASEWRSGNE